MNIDTADIRAAWARCKTYNIWGAEIESEDYKTVMLLCDELDRARAVAAQLRAELNEIDRQLNDGIDEKT